MPATSEDLTDKTNANRIMWQLAAVAGMTLFTAGILVGATGLSPGIPLPSWSLGVGVLFGLAMMVLAGARLLSPREATRSETNTLDDVSNSNE